MRRHPAANSAEPRDARPSADATDRVPVPDGYLSPLVELARQDLREQAAAPETSVAPTPRKTVSRRALEYLQLAQQAINHTKGVIEFQGNQIDAIKATGGNSLYLTDVMRTRAWWQLTPEAKAIADTDPQALVAAKADLLHGGNCAEHAAVAYNYLGTIAKGVTIQRASYADVDHVFVVLGDIQAPEEFPDDELVISDPWPNTPQACLWEDHFVYNPDRAGLAIAASRIGDGTDNKELIKAGLSLTSEGIEQASTYAAPDMLADMMADQRGWGLWDQEDAAASTEFDYQNWDIDRLPMRPMKVRR